jgi:predicted DNA-binding transcriptional regulator AlpA
VTNQNVPPEPGSDKPEDGAGLRRLVRWPVVLAIFPQTRQHISREIRQGKFPAPLQLGPGTPAWWLDELYAHAESLPRGLLTPVPGQRALAEKHRAKRNGRWT